MRGQNDNPVGVEGVDFRASRLALALPTAVIAVGYGLLFATLLFSDGVAGPIARFSLIVLSVGVPFLAAHALLRFLTIRVQTAPHAVFVHTGFPKVRAIEVPYGLIEGVDVTSGFAGRLTESGTLVFSLVDGSQIKVATIRRPDLAHRAISALIDRASASSVAHLRPLLGPGKAKSAATGG